jgi:hypothetical protein
MPALIDKRFNKLRKMEGADKQRKEGVEYKANMGTIHTKEQILEN